jgi:hypothetical protein
MLFRETELFGIFATEKWWFDTAMILSSAMIWGFSRLKVEREQLNTLPRTSVDTNMS